MIKRIKLVNLGPFVELELDLGPGVIGLLGPNGAGKTSLLNALHLGFTGEYRRFGCNKEECVYANAEKGAPSYVEIDAEPPGGAPFTVRRGLQGATSFLKAEGRKLSKNLQAEVNRRLGRAHQVLSATAFHEQGKLDLVVTAEPAARRELLQTLAGLSLCAKVYEEVGARARVEAALAGQGPTDLDGLRAGLAEAQRVLEEREAAALAAASACLSDKQVADRQAYLKKHEEARRFNDQRQAGLAGLADADREAAEAKALLETAEGAAASARKAAEDSEALVGRAQAVVRLGAAWAAYEAEYAKREQELGRKAKKVADAERQRLKLPDPALDLEEARLREQLAAAVVEEKADRSLLRVFAETGLTACPTCGTAVEALHDAIEAARVRLDRDAAAGFRRELDALRADISVRRTNETYVTRATADADAARSALASLAAPAGEKPDAERVRRAQAHLDQHPAKVKRRADAEAAVTVRRAALAAAEKRVARLRAFEATPERPVDGDKAFRASRDLQEDVSRRSDLAVARAQVNGQRELVAKSQQQLDAAVAAGERAAANLYRARKLERVRRAFHPTGMPTRVIARLLAEAEDGVNAWLSAFGDPFAFSCDEELRFHAARPGFAPRAAHLLSGAQRAILALAFWLSVPGPGFLVLDEPTAHLDARNRAALGEAIARLASEAGRQVIVTTHADDLAHAFTQTVVLSANGSA